MSDSATRFAPGWPGIETMIESLSNADGDQPVNSSNWLVSGPMLKLCVTAYRTAFVVASFTVNVTG